MGTVSIVWIIVLIPVAGLAVFIAANLVTGEANLNVFDASFARSQVQQFEQDLAHSRRICAPRWARRSIVRRVLERTAISFRSQL